MNLLDWKHKLLGRPYRCDGSPSVDGGKDSGWTDSAGNAITAGDGTPVGSGSNPDPGSGGGSDTTTQTFDDGTTLTINNKTNQVVSYTDIHGVTHTGSDAQAAKSLDDAAHARATMLSARIPGLSYNDALTIGYLENLPDAQKAMGSPDKFHSAGLSYAALDALAKAGFGGTSLDAFGFSNQTVDQALAAHSVHGYLNENIGQVMGMVGGPAVGFLTRVASDLGQGKDPKAVAMNAAASILGPVLGSKLGIAVPASAITAAASGKPGEAFYNTVVANVSRNLGVSPTVVNNALSGKLGVATTQQVMGMLMSEVAQALPQDVPFLSTLVAPIAAQLGKPVEGVIAELTAPLNQKALDFKSAVVEQTAPAAAVGSATKSSHTSIGIDTNTGQQTSGSGDSVVYIDPKAAYTKFAGPPPVHTVRDRWGNLVMIPVVPAGHPWEKGLNDFISASAGASSQFELERLAAQRVGNATARQWLLDNDTPANIRDYYNSNPDLKAAYVDGSLMGGEKDPTKAAVLHYANYGQLEGRQLKLDTPVTQSSGPSKSDLLWQEAFGNYQNVTQATPTQAQQEWDQYLTSLDAQYTTSDEARGMFKQVYGRDATDADAGIIEQLQNFNEAVAQQEIARDLERTVVARNLLNTNADDVAIRQYMQDFGLTEDNLQRASGKSFSDLMQAADAKYTRDDEALEMYRARFGADSPVDQALIDRMVGEPEQITTALFETAKTRQDDYKSVVFDARDYGITNMDDALAAATEAGYEWVTLDGRTDFKAQSPLVKDVDARTKIAEQKTFDAAFGMAAKELGAGKTFMWGGKQYIVDFAKAAPAGVFDASKASSLDAAVRLAVANGKTTFVGPDGKTHAVDFRQVKDILASTDQSPAETARLLRSAVKPATDETLNETKRLLASGERGALDVFSAATQAALGNGARGVADFLTAQAGALGLVGADYDNFLRRTGAGLEAWGASKMPYGVDEMAAQANRELERIDADNTTLWEKVKAVGEVFVDNPLGYISSLQREIGSEIPTYATVAAGIVLAPFTGGASLAPATAAAVGLGTLENLGNGANEAYFTLKAQGASEETARDAALWNGAMHAVAGLPGEFIVNKALAASLGGAIKTSIGELAKFYGGTVTGAAAAELVEGTLQNAATQYTTTGQINWGQAQLAGVIEAYIGGPTAGAVVLPGAMAQGAVIAKDAITGADVTFQEFLNGTRQINMNTLNTGAVVGKTSEGANLTLGGLAMLPALSGVPIEALRATLPSVVTNNAVVLGTDSAGRPVTLGQISSQAFAGNQSWNTVFNDVFTTTINRAPIPAPGQPPAPAPAPGQPPAPAPAPGQPPAPAPAPGQPPAPAPAPGQPPAPAPAPAPADIAAQLNPMETRLRELMAANEAAGLSRDQALSAAIGTVARELGTTRENLLSQLGTTEQALRQELAGVGQQVTDAETRLRELIDVNEAAGLSRDQALSAAIGTVASELGTTRDALLSRIGTTEQALRQELAGVEGRTTAQIQQVADLLGKPARAVTQADVDFVNSMLRGEQQTDLQYDVDRDGQITQADIDFLGQYIGTNVNRPFVAPEGTVWGPTGLYAEQAKAAAEARAHQQAVMEELARQEAKREADRQAAIRAGQMQQARQGVMSVAQQLPQLMQQSMVTTTPIYANPGERFDFSQPFQSDVFGQRRKRTAPATAAGTAPTPAARMATGGYLGDSDGPQSFDDLLRILN